MRKWINRVCSLTLVLSLFPVYEKQPVTAQAQALSQENVSQVMVTYQSNQEGICSIEVPAEESMSDFINKLEKKPNIMSAEPDYRMSRLATNNDPKYSKQWYHQIIGTEDAWNVTTGSDDIVVAVIDDGIDLHHRDLKNQIIAPYDVVLNSTSRISVGEHGTHVSGIIASTMNNGVGGTGIAPNIKIMPINVFDGENALYSDVIAGIQYAIDQDADIINLSIGGTDPSEMLNEAIQRAYEAGILIIAAAGNEGENMYDYPAAYDHVLAVSATDSYDRLADFSNYGSYIDLAAPGTDIYSTLPHNQYEYMSGTSMATPVIAGVAALVWSANPSLTNTQIEEQLYKTADDLGPVGRDIFFGNGRINAEKAVKIVDKISLAKPIVNDIADNSTKIMGTAEAGVTIKVESGSKLLGTAIVNRLGEFTVVLDKKQTAGTKVTIIAIDRTGNSSNAVIKTVLDKTPPAAPVVNKVTSKSKKITGKAESYSTIYLEKNKKIIGSAKATSKGTFSIKISKKNTTKTVYIYAKDKAKNTSKKVAVTF